MRTEAQRLADVLGRLRMMCMGLKLGVTMCDATPGTPGEVKNLLECVLESTEATIAAGAETGE